MTLYPIDNKIKRIQGKRDAAFEETKYGDNANRMKFWGMVNAYETALRILQEGIDG